MHRVKHVVNCPTCGELISENYYKWDVKQKLSTKTCNNGHVFLLDIGGVRCHTMAITYEGPINE